jgi:hypothetical protein
MRSHLALAVILALAVAAALPTQGRAACCYFSAQNTDILQPVQERRDFHGTAQVRRQRA